MTEKRIKELHSDYLSALTRLEEALDEDIQKGSIILDGTIQRFEYTFELAWKLTKYVLAHNGIDVGTPRLVIKEAYKEKILDEGQGWIDMLEDRNKSVHIYDETQAKKIYHKIREKHLPLLKSFSESILKSIQ